MQNQKRDSRGRFVKNIENQNNNVKIYGNYWGGAWEDEAEDEVGGEIPKYFLVLSDEDFYFYYPEIDKKTKFGYRGLGEAKRRIEIGNWKELSYSFLEKEFPNNLDKIRNILNIPIPDKKEEKLSIEDIKIGSLYNVNGSIYRVVDIQGRLIYVSYHKGAAFPFGISSFKKATKKEVDEYLKLSKFSEDELFEAMSYQ